MKFGLVMSSYVYTEERMGLAKACFESLLETRLLHGAPLLVMVVKPSAFSYPSEALQRKFWLEVHGNSAEGIEFQMSEQPAVYGTDVAFYRGADVVVHLNDDSLMHPDWLVELEGLIDRHPHAHAWSPYRSAREDTHKTLEVVGNDVMVRSLCGLGIAFSRKEWAAMGVSWKQSQWMSPLGSTLDLWHAWARPGERWCTKVSYMEHTGRIGIHSKTPTPEVAVAFAGVSGPIPEAGEER
jgi:hypothetical protein